MMASEIDRLIQSVAARARIAASRTDATDVVIPEIGPPASWDQLERCQASLGFHLPKLLRRLYTEVGNGGFGPGYGLLPVPNGPAMEPGTLIDLYQQCTTPTGLDTWEWPTGLLPVCDWGCLIRSCVYAVSPQHELFTSTEYGVHRTPWTLTTWLADWASNVDLWQVMTENDLGFALHPVTGRPMEYPGT
jgi:hypothetical protein